MDDQKNILSMDDKTRLSADITYLMLKGAGYAALLVLGIWLTIAVIAAIGKALPPESQEAADPSPWSSLEILEPVSDPLV